MSRAAAAGEGHRRGLRPFAALREAPGRSEKRSGLRYWLLGKLHVRWIAEKQERKPDVGQGHPSVGVRPREEPPMAAVRAQRYVCSKTKSGRKRAKVGRKQRIRLFGVIQVSTLQ